MISVLHPSYKLMSRIGSSNTETQQHKSFIICGYLFHEQIVIKITIFAIVIIIFLFSIGNHSKI